jgi:taurine dioxygenase
LIEVASTNKSDSQYYSGETRADHWHADVTFSAAPPTFTTLHALSLPGNGQGDTMWACTGAAYRSLSPSLQATLKTLRAVHQDRSGLERTAEHPAVVGVPRSGGGGGEGCGSSISSSGDDDNTFLTCADNDDANNAAYLPALYLNHQFTRKFAGWTEEESLPLLDFLRARSVAPEFVYRHQWKAGDLVIWDNRATMHYGIFDHVVEEEGEKGSCSGEMADGASSSSSSCAGSLPPPVRVLHRTTAAYAPPVGYQ